MARARPDSAGEIDHAISTPLAERRAAFVRDGTLVADAREVASVVDGREREKFDAFWSHYLQVVPPALRPDSAAAEAMKTAGVRSM